MRLLLLLPILVLGACGGGGGDSSTAFGEQPGPEAAGDDDGPGSATLAACGPVIEAFHDFRAGDLTDDEVLAMLRDVLPHAEDADDERVREQGASVLADIADGAPAEYALGMMYTACVGRV